MVLPAPRPSIPTITSGTNFRAPAGTPIDQMTKNQLLTKRQDWIDLIWSATKDAINANNDSLNQMFDSHKLLRESTQRLLQTLEKYTYLKIDLAQAHIDKLSGGDNPSKALSFSDDDSLKEEDLSGIMDNDDDDSVVADGRRCRCRSHSVGERRRSYSDGDRVCEENEGHLQKKSPVERNTKKLLSSSTTTSSELRTLRRERRDLAERLAKAEHRATVAEQQRDAVVAELLQEKNRQQGEEGVAPWDDGTELWQTPLADMTHDQLVTEQMDVLNIVINRMSRMTNSHTTLTAIIHDHIATKMGLIGEEMERRLKSGGTRTPFPGTPNMNTAISEYRASTGTPFRDMTKVQLNTHLGDLADAGIDTAMRMIDTNNMLRNRICDTTKRMWNTTNRMCVTHNTQSAIIRGHLKTNLQLIQEEMERRRDLEHNT